MSEEAKKAGQKRRTRRKPPAPPGYQLRERLGRGAVGEVWRARGADSLAREFAIKVFPVAGDWERELGSLRKVEQLRAEASSRDLVETFLADEVEGRGYVVMEFLAGGDLWQRVREEGPLGSEAAVELLIPVARALALLHADGLVHKDVKPNNVLLGSDGAPRLADFGLARAVSDPLSQAGTPGFCAPEVYAGGELSTDPRLDVYSLGATLHCLLTGQAPLPGRPDLFELERHDVDRGLQDLLVELLRPDPALRPADGAAVLERLKAWAPEGAAPAAPDRKRALAGAAGALVVLALLGLGASGGGSATTSQGSSSPRSGPSPTQGEGAATPSTSELPSPSPSPNPSPSPSATPNPSPSGQPAGPRPSPAPAWLAATPKPASANPRWDGRELRAAGPALRWRGGEARLPNDHAFLCLASEPVSVARDPSGEVVAAATASGEAVALRIEQGTLRQLRTLPALERPPLIVRVATDGRRLARLLVFAEGADRVELWQLAERDPPTQLAVPPSVALALPPQGRGVILGGLDGRLRIHDGEGIAATLLSHGDSLLALSLGPARLCALGDDRVLSEGALSPRPQLVVRSYALESLLEGEREVLGQSSLAEWSPAR